MFGVTFFLILGIFLWICLALWPAYIAKNKGYNFWLFLLLGIVTSWLISLIVAIIVRDKNQTPESIADEKAAQAAIERETQD